MTTPLKNQPEPVTAGRWCARLLTLLDEQWRAFERLASLAVDHHDGADDAEAIELLRVIDARQPIVQEIEAIDAQLVACQPHWDQNMNQLLPRDRDRIHKAVAAVAMLADRIAEKNKEDRSTLEQRRDGIADELIAVSRGRSAAGAYAGSTQTTARFQDREA